MNKKCHILRSDVSYLLFRRFRLNFLNHVVSPFLHLQKHTEKAPFIKGRIDFNEEWETEMGSL